MGKKKISNKKLLQMLMEWCLATEDFHGDYNAWWKKYPSYSLKQLLEITKKNLKSINP